LSEVFATGASLTLLDHFSPELRKIIAGLEGFDKSVQTSQVELRKLGFGNLAVREGKKLDALVGMTGVAVDKMTAHFDRLGLGADKAFDAVKAASGGAFTAMKTESGEAIAATVADMGNLSKVATAEFDAVKLAASGAFGQLDADAKAAASGALTAFGDLSKGATTEFDAIKAASAGLWTGLSEGASASVDAALGSIGRLDAALEAATLRMKGMADAAAAAAAGGGLTPIVPRNPVPRNPASPHNKAHGGFHLRPHGMAIPGGHLGASQGGDGMAPLVGGIVTGEILKDALGKAFDFRHWETQFEAAGFSQSEVQKASKSAWANAAQNQNTSATENIGRLYEMIKVFPEFDEKKPTLDEAITFLPAFNNIMTGLQSVKSEGIHSKFSSGKQVFELAKGLEETGVTQRGTNEEREKNTKAMMSELFKTMLSERGVTDGSSFYAMTNNSGGAAQNWDMRMATVVAPILGSVMKHSKLGNADYMANRSYASGIVTSKAVGNLVSSGLVDDDIKSGKVWQDKKQQWHLEPNSQFAEGMSENVWDWSGGVLDKLKAHGVDTHNQKAVNQVINGIGSNKSTTMMMRALLEPATRMQIVKDMALRDAVPDNAVDILQNKDPVLKLDALHKKTEDFLTALGGPLVDPAIAVLTKLTSGINAFAQAMEAHPDLTKVGAMGAGVAALGLTGYGAARMLGFGGGGAALSGAATALDASALALKEAAAALGGGAVHGGTPGSGTSVPATGGKPSLWAMAYPLAIYEGGKAAIDGFVPWLFGSTPEQHEKAQSYNPWDHPIFGDKTIGGVLKDAIMPSAHAAEGAPIPGLNLSPVTGQASTAIAGRLGLPAGIDMSGAIERATVGLGVLQKQEELNVWQFGQLTTSTGIVQTSFDGLNTRATGITGALASFSAALDAATAKVYGLFGGGAGAGDVGSGSGFTNAAYTTWDSTGGASGRALPNMRYGVTGHSHGGGSSGGTTGTAPFMGDAGKPFAGSHADFLASIMPGAIEASKRTGIDPRIIAAQAAHESAWGKHAPGNNFFGIKGPGQMLGTHEEVGGHNVSVMASFRKYPSMAEGVAGYADFINHNRRYEPFKKAEGLESQLRELGRSGYATDSHYAEKIGAIAGRIQVPRNIAAGRPAATVSAPPPRKVSPGVPAGGNMTTAMNDTRPQQHHIYLDGKKIAQVVTKHQASAMRFPNSMGGPDPHGHYTSPGTPLSDVA